MEVIRVTKNSGDWQRLIDYAGQCSWKAVGAHLADMMEKNVFTDWESVFCAKQNGQIVGFCTFLKTDYYPENRYSPWISSVYVQDEFRGNRFSQQMIEFVIEYAKQTGFSKVYLPSDITSLYEKYGFEKIDSLVNYDGGTDAVFMRRC